jgi:hypothetical protein
VERRLDLHGLLSARLKVAQRRVALRLAPRLRLGFCDLARGSHPIVGGARAERAARREGGGGAVIRARRGAGDRSRSARVSGAARATRRCAQNGRARGRARATTHPAVGLAVHFVAEDHEREVLGVARARLAEELFPPGVETLERLSLASAESSSVSVAAAADGPRRGAATRHVWTPRRAAAAIKNDAARRGAQSDRGQGGGGRQRGA